MFERIISEDNLDLALKKVRRNNGVAGIDNMTIYELDSQWFEIRDAVIQKLREESYEFKLIKRVYIPKQRNKLRPLGIPCVIDRVIQQAILQVIYPIFENNYFSKFSYGFRTNRSCEHAVDKFLEYVNNGYTFIVDIDIEDFFNNLNHDLLISKLKEKIHDEKVIKLIKRVINTKVLDKYNLIENKIGIIQGNNLSPVLANIYLTELDKYLESKSYKFVRYADDIIAACESENDANKIMYEMKDILNNKLLLNTNNSKSKITNIDEVSYLGFSFKKVDSKYVCLINYKNLEKLYCKLLKLLDRKYYYSNGKENTIMNINSTYLGFINYYKSTYDVSQITINLDKYIITKLMLNSLKNYKNDKTKIYKLNELGLCKEFIEVIMKSNRREYWKLCEYYINKSNIYNLKEIKYLKNGTLHLSKLSKK